MKKLLLIILIFLLQNYPSQIINIQKYGALGNGINDETDIFLKAIKELKSKYSSINKPSTLYLPNGSYKISKSLVLDKYISIIGEFTNTTQLITDTPNIPMIIFEKNRVETQIYNSYNYIKNISLLGTETKKNFAGHKDKPTSNQSIGIWVKGLRTRIDHVQIEGFENSGIEINDSYYTFITNAFIKNNAIGVHITNTSTSVYLSNSELRFNSIGVLIDNNSFGNFINNNMIESNLATFLPYDNSLNQNNTQSTGRGIIIKKASANNINNNYLENHFVQFTLDNAQKNNISNNFYAISNTTVTSDKNQIFLQMIGDSNENTIQNNSYLTSDNNLDATKIIIDNKDFSSNKINVGKDNAKLNLYLKKVISNEKFRPIQ